MNNNMGWNAEKIIYLVLICVVAFVTISTVDYIYNASIHDSDNKVKIEAIKQGSK